MALFQQLTQLLSQPPGTIIYHLVTLFALQVVFAISLSHWRRNRDDGLARRMMWAAAAIWLLRVSLLSVGFVTADTPTPSLLPPLIQAVQALTAIFLLWSLSIQTGRWPRPSDTLLAIGVIFIVVITLFFAQTWRTLAAEGAVYEESTQALFWLLFQIVIYGTGLLLSLLESEGQRSLRPFIFGLFLAATMIQLALPPSANLVVWQRLADFIAFPLWAVLAYRHVLMPLLLWQVTSQPATEQLADLLQQATTVIATPFATDTTVQNAIQMVQQQVDVTFVAIALLDNDILRVTSNRPQRHEDRPQSWLLALHHWPALRTAVDNQERLDLQPNGLGARQLHQLYEEFGLPTDVLAPLIVQPLKSAEEVIGLLLLAHTDGWSAAGQRMIAALIDYVTQVVVNGRHYQQALTQAVEDVQATLTDPSPIGTGRVIALETENKRLEKEMQLAWDRLYQEEQRTAAARQQARDLAATIEEMRHNYEKSDKVALLQAEVESLRESLIQAEEAVAMASAADSGLSTEWVMQAITRYSGELEEAQSRIEYLEIALRNRRDDSPRYEMIASLAEELRTPLTSVAGYTDLLLGDAVGALTARQRDFLQRVRANTERLSALLEQVIQLAAVGEEELAVPDVELVDTREVIESAVHTVITRMQDKNLRLDMDIPDTLEPLSINREALRQIMVNLLNNACQSSQRDGRVAVRAYTEAVRAAGNGTPIRFMHITITDTGRGIRAEDRARVFDPHLAADDPLIEGLGDTAAGLAVARNLTQTYGGRIWVDSEVGQGSIFSLVFPMNPVNGGER
jgi:signal transduction histidine kinase